MPLNLARVEELWASGFVCRVDRIREQLNVTAEVDLPEGLADTAAWYEREGWL
jgi:nucleoside-diphosphate-sugar epimerase